MIIALNNVRSAWNVGSVMRTCDALNADAIFIGYTPLPTGKTLKLVKKTAIGAEDTVKWEHFPTFKQVLEAYPDHKHIAIEISKTSQDIFKFLKESKTDPKNIILWFGNEISGIEPEILKHMDQELHLPMLGMKESLNVANTVCTVGYLFLEHSLVDASKNTKSNSSE